MTVHRHNIKFHEGKGRKKNQSVCFNETNRYVWCFCLDSLCTSGRCLEEVKISGARQNLLEIWSEIFRALASRACHKRLQKKLEQKLVFSLTPLAHKMISAVKVKKKKKKREEKWREEKWMLRTPGTCYYTITAVGFFFFRKRNRNEGKSLKEEDSLVWFYREKLFSVSPSISPFPFLLCVCSRLIYFSLSSFCMSVCSGCVSESGVWRLRFVKWKSGNTWERHRE